MVAQVTGHPGMLATLVKIPYASMILGYEELYQVVLYDGGGEYSYVLWGLRIDVLLRQNQSMFLTSALGTIGRAC